MTSPRLIALADVGYLEKKSNKLLNSKTGNAGHNNYTKYPPMLGYKNPQAWCLAMIEADFVKAYGKTLALEMLYAKRFSLLCQDQVNNFKKAKKWYKTPKVGDLIFFDYDHNGVANHVGLVNKVTNTFVYTIEGNSGDGVKKHSYRKGIAMIMGYGRPNYDLVKKPKAIIKVKAPAKTTTKAPAKKVDVSKYPVIRFGSRGIYVKKLQKKLGIKADGIFGVKTRATINAYQRKHKLKVDGICGKQVWNHIYNG